jgi:hypothetical protein
MDLSKFSNEELMALKAGDMSKISDENLRFLQNKGQEPDEIVQETHPDFGWADRFAIKNFGGSPETIDAYIKKQGFETKTDSNGQRLIKKDTDTKWSVLDPEGLDLADISDIGYDIVSGLGSGVATAAAGLGAGAATLGAGAIPVAMAAGAGSSAGLEFLRQKIGSGLGTHQGDTNTGDVALAGGLGALSPLLFGTGASAAKVGLKSVDDTVARKLLGSINAAPMVGEALTSGDKVLAKELLGESQRGIGKMLFRSKAAKNAQKQAPDAVKQALGVDGKLTMLQAGDLLDRTGIKTVVDNLADSMRDKMYAAKETLQTEFTNALDNIGGVDPRPHYEHFQKLITDLRNSDLEIANTDQVKKLIADTDKLFFRKVELPETGEIAKEAIESLSGQDAMRLKQQLKELSTTFVNSLEGKPAHSQEVMKTADQAMRSLSGDIDKRLNEAGGKDLMGRYRAFKEMDREVIPLFDDPKKLYSFLRTADTKTKKYVADGIMAVDRKFNLGVGDSADQLDVMAKYARAPWNPVSDATTSTSKTLDLQAGGNAIGRTVGNALGGNVTGILGAATGRIGMGKIASRGMEKKLLQAKDLLKNLGLHKASKEADAFTVGDLIRGIDEFKYRPSAPSTFNMITNAKKERGE